MKEDKNNVVVALMNSKSDFEIARKMNWYRIPVKSAPAIVKNNHVKFIAFYFTKVFDAEKYSVRWFGKVKKISVVKRKELFPGLTNDEKSENNYYKIEFEKLFPLPNIIESKRGRRILFIPTTEEKLFCANEINELFNDSPLENILWEKFSEKNIAAERQFYIEINDARFVLDFAVFCKTRNINIECDGDTFHSNYEKVKKDKQRNNILESAGWSVLRFSTDDLLLNFPYSFELIKNTINKYGGMQHIKDFESYRYITGDDDMQLLLFE